MSTYSPKQIKEKYSRIAARYDAMEAIPEFLGLSRIRRDLFRNACGHVLEVAAGTGKNLKAYRNAIRLTAIDVSPEMLHVAERKARRLGMTVVFKVMDAHSLEFPDNSFDTVSSSLSACTFTDPVRAISEMIRVCKPEGKILLLEHGRSNKNRINKWLDKNEASHAETFGCHWNRDIDQLLSQTNLKITRHRKYFFAVFHAIEASPNKLY